MAPVVTSAVDFGTPNAPPIGGAAEVREVVPDENPNTEVEDGAELSARPLMKV